MSEHDDKQKQAAERAKQARALAEKQAAERAAGLPGGTPRIDMLPIEQEAARQAAETQLKTQETAEEQEARAAAVANYNAAQEMQDSAEEDQRRQSAELAANKAAKKKEKFVEVELKKKYTPENWADDEGNYAPQGEIKKTLPAGSTVMLPKAEAERAFMLDIARPTAKTFE